MTNYVFTLIDSAGGYDVLVLHLLMLRAHL